MREKNEERMRQEWKRDKKKDERLSVEERRNEKRNEEIRRLNSLKIREEGCATIADGKKGYRFGLQGLRSNEGQEYC